MVNFYNSQFIATHSSVTKQEREPPAEMPSVEKITKASQAAFEDLSTPNSQIWEKIDCRKDPISGGGSFIFRMPRYYDYSEKGISEKEKTERRQRFDEKTDSIGAPQEVPPSFSSLESMISIFLEPLLSGQFDRLREARPKIEAILRNLGFQIGRNEKEELIFELPDPKKILHGWEHLRQDPAYHYLPKLNIAYSQGIASHLGFIKILIVDPKADCLVSTREEWMHDISSHVFATIITMISDESYEKRLAAFREMIKPLYEFLVDMEKLIEEKVFANDEEKEAEKNDLEIAEISLGASIDFLFAGKFPDDNQTRSINKSTKYKNLIVRIADEMDIPLHEYFGWTNYPKMNLSKIDAVWDRVVAFSKS